MPRLITKLKRPAVRMDDASNPDAWRAVGRRLLKGARLLWVPLDQSIQGYTRTRGNRTEAESREFTQQADYFGPFFVIAGLAVENFLKARLIERRIAEGTTFPDVASVIKAFPKNPHDQVKLAELAGVPLSPSTESLLKRLTAFVEWAGKYPVPKDQTKAAFERTTRENDLADIENFIASLNR